MRDLGYGPESAGLAEPVTVVEAALAVPGGRFKGRLRPASVVDASGAPVVDAGDYGKGRFIGSEFIDRAETRPSRHCDGAWMFGGQLQTHFGHFLFETISRLWAVDLLRAEVRGIAFFRPRPTTLMGAHLERILGLLDVDLPMEFIDAPTSFDRLFVPRQGAALGPLSAGTPAFRHFVRSKLSRIAPREGAPKIWLTRENYRLRRGGIFDEITLRRRLEAEGYTSFAPETASFEEQVATYRGASHIIGPDSSAMHLVGYVARPETRIAIVLRRPDGHRHILPQIAGFTGRVPAVLDAMTRIIRHDGTRNPNWSVFAELDWPLLWHHLSAAGFLSGAEPWQAMRRVRRLQLLKGYEARLKGRFEVVWRAGQPLPPDLAELAG